MGGGLLEPDGLPATELQEGNFVALSSEECLGRFLGLGGDFDLSNIDLGNIEDFLCVDPEDDDSICQGDSGGPLVFTDETTKDHVLVGVTSFSAGCNPDEVPDGFTRVSMFYDWIREQICAISRDPPEDCPPPTPPARSRRGRAAARTDRRAA